MQIEEELRVINEVIRLSIRFEDIIEEKLRIEDLRVLFAYSDLLIEFEDFSCQALTDVSVLFDGFVEFVEEVDFGLDVAVGLVPWGALSGDDFVA